jgi:hypothetical protein
VWAVPFALVLGILLVRNAFLFSTALYEDADMGANSILIERARRFTLLVGHYSQNGFNHPGPAFLYVQSWGESLFWALLHVVPTAWNGQLIAVYALNALFAALVVAIGYGWTGSVRGAAGAGAVVACLVALHPAMFSSDWTPYSLVPAYFAFLVAVASVTAGRGQDAWIAALTGWFLIHGYASFLFFVPLIALAALVAVAWPRRGRLRSSALRLARQRWIWVPVLVISAVFALPIALELAAHWPGNFGKYLSYSSPSLSPLPSMAHVADYTLWLWWPHADAWLVALALSALAGVLTWRLPPGPARRFCGSLIAFDALSTLLFEIYAMTGIRDLQEVFAGYFYWSAPAILLLVIVLAAVEALQTARGAPPWLGAAAAVTAAIVACVAFAVAPQTRTSTDHADPGVLASGADTDPALSAGAHCDPLPARRLARGHRIPRAGRTDRRDRLRRQNILGLHDDEPVHLHPRGARERREFRLLRARHGSARCAGGGPASASPSDQRPQLNVAWMRGPANIRARERVRRYLHLPWSAAAVPGRGGALSLPPCCVMGPQQQRVPAQRRAAVPGRGQPPGVRHAGM